MFRWQDSSDSLTRCHGGQFRAMRCKCQIAIANISLENAIHCIRLLKIPAQRRSQHLTFFFDFRLKRPRLRRHFHETMHIKSSNINRIINLNWLYYSNRSISGTIPVLKYLLRMINVMQTYHWNKFLAWSNEREFNFIYFSYI